MHFTCMSIKMNRFDQRHIYVSGFDVMQSLTNVPECKNMQWIHVVSMKFLLQRQFYHIIENKSAGLKYLDGNLIPIFSPFDRFF